MTNPASSGSDPAPTTYKFNFVGLYNLLGGWFQVILGLSFWNMSTTSPSHGPLLSLGVVFGISGVTFVISGVLLLRGEAQAVTGRLNRAETELAAFKAKAEDGE